MSGGNWMLNGRVLLADTNGENMKVDCAYMRSWILSVPNLASYADHWQQGVHLTFISCSATEVHVLQDVFREELKCEENIKYL